MEAFKLRKIYTGQVFWIRTLGFDIIMETKYGTSYNSYLLKRQREDSGFLRRRSLLSGMR